MGINTGDRIYYTGDMANEDGYGKVTSVTDSRWGKQIAIEMKDGRTMTVGPESFVPSPGRRFWLADEWNEDRRVRLAKSQAEILRVLAARQCNP